MIEDRNSKRELIRSLEGKKVFLITKSGLHYRTNNIQLVGESVLFNDKYNLRVMIEISEISQIVEVHDNGN